MTTGRGISAEQFDARMAELDARRRPQDAWFDSIIDRALKNPTAAEIAVLREEVLRSGHYGRGVLLKHLAEIEAVGAVWKKLAGAGATPDRAKSPGSRLMAS